MIRAPRLRSLVAAALALLPPVHGASVTKPPVSSISREALLDLGAKLDRAIWSHESKRVTYLLKKGASPDPLGDLDSPLQRAISRGDTAIFRKLLEAGANPGLQVRDLGLFPTYYREFGNLYGDSIPLLFEAATQPNPVFTRTLLERGANPKIVSHGINAAFVATRFDNLDVLRLLADSLGGMARPDSQRIADHAAVHGAFSVLDDFKSHGVRPNPDSLCEGLALAIKERDSAEAVVFLDHGAPLEPKEPSAHSPLLRAIDNDSWGMFELLLAKGAKPGIKNKDGVSAVLLAAKKPDTTWLVRLLAKGADINVTNSDGQNALYSAASANVPVLLGRKIKVDVVDNNGVSPLVNACKRLRWDVARMLLEAGAGVRPISSEGEAALALVIAARRFDLAQRILDRGGNINAVTSQGSTILQMAIASTWYRTDTQTCEWILRHGADPSLPDASNRTPVETAARMAEWDRLALLVRYGAKTGLKPYAAKLVTLAMERGDDSLLATLVANGCSLDAPDTNLHMDFDREARGITYTGEPALIQAIRIHSLVKVAKLLRHGASPDVVDRDGVPALLLAVSLYEIEVVRLLLEHRANVSKRDANQDGIEQYLGQYYPYPQMAELFSLKGRK